MNRARALADQISPFTLTGTRFVTDDDDGQNGVFVELHDPTGSWHELRRQLLAPPLSPSRPRPTSPSADPEPPASNPTAWASLRDRPISCHLVADTLSLTITSATNHRNITERLPLTVVSGHGLW